MMFLHQFSIWFSPGILISTGSSIVVTFISGLFKKSIILYNVVVLPSPVGAAIKTMLFLLLKHFFTSSGSFGNPNSNICCTSAFFFKSLKTNFSP